MRIPTNTMHKLVPPPGGWGTVRRQARAGRRYRRMGICGKRKERREPTEEDGNCAKRRGGGKTTEEDKED
jgi:hypothetical protein